MNTVVEKNGSPISPQQIMQTINNRGANFKPKANQFRIMMQVVGFDNVDGHYWASGYKLGGTSVERNPRQAIRIRLNTVEERVKDELMHSNGASQADVNAIRNKVNSLYNMGKKRKTLQEYNQGYVFMLSFERVVALGSKDNIDYYRAHWATNMSANPNSQFIQGLAHIRMIQEDLRGNRKATCQVEVIEAMMLDANNKDNAENNKFIAKALNNSDPTVSVDTAERTGKLMIEFVLDGQRNPKVIDIYNERTEVELIDYNNNKIKVKRSASYADTVQAYLTAQDYHTRLYKNNPNNNYHKENAFQADISRQVLGYLLGINARSIPVARNDLAESTLYPMANSLYNKEIKINLFAVRIYFYGDMSKAKSLANELAHGLNKKYAVAIQEDGRTVPFHSSLGLPATPTYTPTAIAVQRYDDGTPYVVFAGSISMNNEDFTISSNITPEMVDGCKDFYQKLM